MNPIKAHSTRPTTAQTQQPSVNEMRRRRFPLAPPNERKEASVLNQAKIPPHPRRNEEKVPHRLQLKLPKRSHLLHRVFNSLLRRNKKIKRVKMQEKKLTEVEEIETTALSIISSNSKSTRLNVHRSILGFAAECELSADEAEIFLRRYQSNHNCVSPPHRQRDHQQLPWQSNRCGSDW